MINCLNSAVTSHRNWVQAFRAELDPDSGVDPIRAGNSNICELGKWLGSDDAREAMGGTYDTLVHKDNEFHHAAHFVAEKFNQCLISGGKSNDFHKFLKLFERLSDELLFILDSARNNPSITQHQIPAPSQTGLADSRLAL